VVSESRESRRIVESGLEMFSVIYGIFIFFVTLNCFLYTYMRNDKKLLRSEI